MLTLALIFCLAAVLAIVARRSGARRLIAVGLPTSPALLAFIYYAIRHDIEIGPHGGIIPAWIVAGIVLLLVAVVSSIVAFVVPRREP